MKFPGFLSPDFGNVAAPKLLRPRFSCMMNSEFRRLGLRLSRFSMLPEKTFGMWSRCNSVAPSAFPVLHIPFYPGKKDSRPLFSGSRWTPGDKGGGSGGSFIPPLPIRAFLPDNCAVKAALCKFPLETRECRFASVFSLEKSQPCPAFSERDVGKTVWNSLNPGKRGMGAPEILGMEETGSRGRPWICSSEPETRNSLEF